MSWHHHKLDGRRTVWEGKGRKGSDDGMMDGWMVGRMEGWKDGRMEGWMDGWMD